MPTRPPLDPAIAASRGLSPRQRAELDAAAKGKAMEWVWAVKRRNAAGTERIARELGPQGVYALAVILAEGITPGNFRLLEVTRAASDGAPGAVGEAV